MKTVKALIIALDSGTRRIREGIREGLNPYEDHLDNLWNESPESQEAVLEALLADLGKMGEEVKRLVDYADQALKKLQEGEK